jgi:predicted NUDIX family NTP pyrophosphohydrolase
MTRGGDAEFLRRLKDRRLCLGRSAVNFIRKAHLRKDGALDESILHPAGPLVHLDDVGAGDFSRQQPGKVENLAAAAKFRAKKLLVVVIQGDRVVSSNAFKQSCALHKQQVR